ncbi:glycerol kinase GlpK [Lacimicrobium alkaliphilum]|uniref:Glycerol kinase n=1 Tax=Lacimicrobium alkaliphilum TaxID=1526571 RepID=A0ABQ1R8J3_9ALTE|nr:glycerol kinase GlpK [Lacimicrobium alkaliphilum]GGD62199.1 glycerol kinase 1 [Lacimicrobium alkaliphilum]
MSRYLLGIDHGTTSSRAILLSPQGEIVDMVQQEFPQHYPHAGWVEHQPDDLWQSVRYCCTTLLSRNQLSGEDIIALGIGNQRETTLIWDKDTGEPIYNAIVWQDRRTAAYCQKLAAEDPQLAARLQSKTGLLLDPYFCASKIYWILNNVQGAKVQAMQGKLLFGTVETYLLWKLTGGKYHCTDATNASRTLLFNIHTQQWDEELLVLFDIPPAMLPGVCDNAAEFGHTQHELLGGPVPILAMAGDQQAGLIGQCCFEPGMAKSTYGTGCFLMLNTGKQALLSQHRLLTTVGYRLQGEVTYALEGSIFMAGATIQWLRDGLNLIQQAGESEALAKEVGIDHGVLLVPAFTGLGAPYWDPDARGAILGLTRDTGIREIVSAGLQAVCYQSKDLQKSMQADGVRPTDWRVDGGMVANDWLMQFLADMLGANVRRSSIAETTALGVAYLAGLQAGVFQSLEHIAALWQQDKLFTPKMAKAQRDRLYANWQQGVKRIQTRNPDAL